MVTSISISRRWRHMRVEFEVGSLSCSERFFSGYSGFPLFSKTNTSKFQFDLERTDTFKWVHMNSYVLRGQTNNLHFFYTSLIRTPFSVRIRENRVYSASYISSILFNWLLGIINNFGSIFWLLFLPQKRKLDPLKSFKYHQHQHKGNKVWVFLRFLNHFSFL